MNPSNAFVERVHSIFTNVVGQRRHQLDAARLFKMVFIRMIIRGNGAMRWDVKSEKVWNEDEQDDVARVMGQILEEIEIEEEVDNEVILVK